MVILNPWAEHRGWYEALVGDRPPVPLKTWPVHNGLLEVGIPPGWPGPDDAGHLQKTKNCVRNGWQLDP